QAQQRVRLLEEVRDLRGLAENPRMLGFITEIEEGRLHAAAAREASGEITAAALYRELLTQWLGRERTQLDRPGQAPPPSMGDLWSAVTDLALRLWRSGQDTLAFAEVDETAAALAARAPQAGAPLEPGQATQLLGARTLLVRTGDAQFTFVHRSVLEWLVCHAVSGQLATGHTRPEALTRKLSPLMVEFFADLAGREAITGWIRAVLTETVP